MPLTAAEEARIDLALALGHFGASAISILAAAAASGNPIGENEIASLTTLLETSAERAPAVAKPYFDDLRGALLGDHYKRAES